jgi:hypothetical protein
MYVCSSTSFFLFKGITSWWHAKQRIDVIVHQQTAQNQLPGGAWHRRATQNKAIVGVLRAQRTSNDFECIIIQIFQWYSYRYLYIYMYMYNIYIMYGCTTPIWLWAKTFTSTYPGISWGRPAARAPMVPMDPSCRHPWLWPTLMWVKQCHKPPTTGNDLNWWFGGMVWLWLFYKQ